MVIMDDTKNTQNSLIKSDYFILIEKWKETLAQLEHFNQIEVDQRREIVRLTNSFGVGSLLGDLSNDN